MFSASSELTPRAPIPDGRMEQIMQPWMWQTKQINQWELCIYHLNHYFGQSKRSGWSYCSGWSGWWKWKVVKHCAWAESRFSTLFKKGRGGGLGQTNVQKYCWRKSKHQSHVYYERPKGQFPSIKSPSCVSFTFLTLVLTEKWKNQSQLSRTIN